MRNNHKNFSKFGKKISEIKWILHKKNSNLAEEILVNNPVIFNYLRIEISAKILLLTCVHLHASDEERKR